MKEHARAVSTALESISPITRLHISMLLHQQLPRVGVYIY
jgi:hypothetical protein